MVNFIEDVSVLSDQELLSYSTQLANHENETGLKIIACLREAEKRMLYAQLGLGSLWEYATQFLKLSNGNAQMKIDAMRLGRENPIAREKMKSGELSIPNAAKVNSFFRQERKAGHSYTSQEKTEVIESVLGLSQSKCERALLARAPESIPSEKIRPLTETKTELKLVVDEKTLAILQRLKELLSHKMPNATYAELLEYLAREKIEILERKLLGATLEELENQHSHSTPPGGGVEALCEKFQLLGIVEKKDNNRKENEEVQAETAVAKETIPTPRAYIPVKDRRWAMQRAM